MKADRANKTLAEHLPAPMIFPDLSNTRALEAAAVWQPLRAGIEISWLYGDGQEGPAAALLRYQAGASVPAHRHTGYEHVLVLAGSQQDENGIHGAGTLVINPPGSRHAVASDYGCTVLIIWEKAIVFEPAQEEKHHG